MWQDYISISLHELCRNAQPAENPILARFTIEFKSLPVACADANFVVFSIVFPFSLEPTRRFGERGATPPDGPE